MKIFIHAMAYKIIDDILGHTKFLRGCYCNGKNLQGLLMVLTIVLAKRYNIFDLSETNAYVLVST